MTAVSTEAGRGGGGIVAQAITELAGHHVSTSPLGERGGGLQWGGGDLQWGWGGGHHQGGGVLQGHDHPLLDVTASAAPRPPPQNPADDHPSPPLVPQRTQGEVGGGKVAKDNSEPLSPEDSEVPAEEEMRGKPPEIPKG